MEPEVLFIMIFFTVAFTVPCVFMVWLVNDLNNLSSDIDRLAEINRELQMDINRRRLINAELFRDIMKGSQ